MIKKQSITPFKLFLILIHTQIGVGIVTLPYDIFMKTKESAWITVLVSGMIIQALIFLFAFIIKRYPSLNLLGIVREHFGKSIGVLLSSLYTIYFLLIVVAVLIKYVVILKTWMMPITPKWAIVMFTLIVSIFASREGLSVMARFFFIASFVLIIFLALSSIALKDAKLTYILPVLKDGFNPLIKGIPTTIYSFQGFEVLLFLYPFVEGSGKAIVKAASLANVFVVFLYSHMVLVNVLFFSSAELPLIPQPVLYLVKSLSFRIIERPDLLFTAMWIVLVVTTLIVLLYVANISFNNLLKKQGHGLSLYVLSVICFLGSMLIYGEYKINDFIAFIQPFMVLFSIIIPVVIVVYSYLVYKLKGVKTL